MLSSNRDNAFLIQRKIFMKIKILLHKVYFKIAEGQNIIRYHYCGIIDPVLLWNDGHVYILAYCEDIDPLNTTRVHCIIR